MKLKEPLEEVRKMIRDMLDEISDTRREIQMMAQDLKITPIRNILMDGVKVRRPVKKILRALRGD